jgi:hypothetical protein
VKHAQRGDAIMIRSAGLLFSYPVRAYFFV